ncbi:MAG: LPS export ABC transporter periplasmic protein LptC [Chitinophagaceae bacterium]
MTNVFRIEAIKVLCLVLPLFVACRNDLKSIHEVIQPSLLNQENARDVKIYYSKEGKTKAALSTKTFRHVLDAKPTYVEMKDGLQVIFYDDSLREISRLRARYGKMFDESGNVLVRDSVVVTNQKQEMLQTEELVWNNKLQQFYTEQFVKISTPTRIIYGDGLESNQYFSEYRIKNVRGIIGLNKTEIPAP